MLINSNIKCNNHILNNKYPKHKHYKHNNNNSKVNFKIYNHLYRFNK